MGYDCNHNSTLGEVATGFLCGLPLEDRIKAQAEVYRFIRWVGLDRKACDVDKSDVSGYSRQAFPSSVFWTKSFLSYIYDKKLVKSKLSSFIRSKKSSAAKTTTSFKQERLVTLTTEGYAEFEKELAHLKGQRPMINEEIRNAAADKDFRENAPLDAAREQQSHLEGKIQELESLLRQAKIMEEKQTNSCVQIGDVILLHVLSCDKEFRYIMVDTREANPRKGMISTTSPLGLAIMGKRKGETINVCAPGGSYPCHLKDIQHC